MTKYKINVVSSAIVDLQNIVDYISLDNPSIASNILDKLEKRIDSLKEYPVRGRIIPELASHNIIEYRELIETPWRIIYKVVEHEVFVFAVVDGRRNIQDILLRKLLK